jgi:hypothetical protein
MERVTLKQLLRGYVEQGLAAEAVAVPHRRVADLPRIAKPESLRSDQLSNAALFALLEE